MFYYLNSGALAVRLRAGGTDLILEPFQDAADQAADLLIGMRQPPRFQVIEPEDQKELAS